MEIYHPIDTVMGNILRKYFAWMEGKPILIYQPAAINQKPNKYNGFPTFCSFKGLYWYKQN